jgi:hypothetical protein
MGGSGILKKPIPDQGFKKAPDPGSGSATPVATKNNSNSSLSYHWEIHRNDMPNE